MIQTHYVRELRVACHFCWVSYIVFQKCLAFFTLIFCILSFTDKKKMNKKWCGLYVRKTATKHTSKAQTFLIFLT